MVSTTTPPNWASVIRREGESQVTEVLKQIPILYHKTSLGIGYKGGVSTTLLPLSDEKFAETGAKYWKYFLGIEPPPDGIINLEAIDTIRRQSTFNGRPQVPVGTSMYVCGAVFVWTDTMANIKAPWLLVVNRNWADPDDDELMKNHNSLLYYPRRTYKQLLSALLYLERHTAPDPKHYNRNQTLFYMSDANDADAITLANIPYSPVHRVFFTHMEKLGWSGWLGVPTDMATEFRDNILVPDGVRLVELTGRLATERDDDTYCIDYVGSIVCTCASKEGSAAPGVGSTGFLINGTCSIENAVGTISDNKGFRVRGSRIERTVEIDKFQYRKASVLASRDFMGSDFLDKTKWALTQEFTLHDKPYSCIPLEWVYDDKGVYSTAKAPPELEGTTPPKSPGLRWYRCQCATACHGRDKQGLICLQANLSNTL